MGSAKGYTFRRHWKERVNCSRCTLEGDQNIWEVGGSVVLQGGQGGWEEVKYFGRGGFCVNLPNFQYCLPQLLQNRRNHFASLL